MNYEKKKLIITNTNSQIKDYFSSMNLNLSDSQISQLSTISYNKFVYIDSNENTRELYTKPGGIGGGKVQKVSNVLLNWSKLLETSFSFLGISPDWTIIIVGLFLIKNTIELFDIKINERMAMILWTMRSRIGNNNYKKIDDILILINHEFTTNHKSPISIIELNESLLDLEKLRCVSSNNNDWCLLEKIIVT